MGCDADSRPLRIAVEVSIHAPTWGATDSHPSLAFSGVFQSTHPRGVRHCLRFTVMRLGLFQSTHPRGVRQLFLSRFPSKMVFQSTHPRGVRRYDSNPSYSLQPVSIHAPTWGATCLRFTVMRLGLFQSTHPRGVRQLFLSRFPSKMVFQSTHPRGVRPPLPMYHS